MSDVVFRIEVDSRETYEALRKRAREIRWYVQRYTGVSGRHFVEIASPDAPLAATGQLISPSIGRRSNGTLYVATWGLPSTRRAWQRHNGRKTVAADQG